MAIAITCHVPLSSPGSTHTSNLMHHSSSSIFAYESAIPLRLESSLGESMSTALSSSVFETNPYEGQHNLSELEAEVLWQYAKLSQNIKEVRSL